MGSHLEGCLCCTCLQAADAEAKFAAALERGAAAGGAGGKKGAGAAKAGAGGKDEVRVSSSLRQRLGL